MAGTPLMILAYASVMNLNSLLRDIVDHPIRRWLWVMALYVGVYYYRVQNLPPAPATYLPLAHDKTSLVLVVVGLLLGGFYLAFVAGCAIQCALKDRTLKDLAQAFSR
ncbi:putative transmembrane protein [Gregarina niphandrodes]|uniref:Transmembrane protein n=1 Tax=Gregarina niphandrodes TaxID=110365 RepID=A0A023AZ28_GRENI|nr:putative transmembrane protein [Gregarina niphandrodes]EZG43888.1 putative transmembrane protein [Gregarina niphandrodes]|eukprot:XP_011132931.1 putative transmembrane protein [Gregarina niphandrodes]